jgi:translation initiation factor RLI1
VKGNVGEIIAKKDDKKIADRLVAMLDLDNRLNRTVEQLSGAVPF